MNIILTDEELIRIELLANRCQGICETGKLLHRLYTAYVVTSKELKKANLEAWERIQGNDKSNMGTK